MLRTLCGVELARWARWFGAHCVEGRWGRSVPPFWSRCNRHNFASLGQAVAPRVASRSAALADLQSV